MNLLKKQRLRNLVGLFLGSVLTVFMSVQIVSAEMLTMAYRTTAKIPYIKKAPDSTGFYLDLYSKALERMGHELRVTRLPKAEIFELMKAGKIDFYPGLSFSEKRASFLYFIDNGTPGGNMGISRKDLPEITDLNQLKGKTLVEAVGGVDFLKGIEGVNLLSISELSNDAAIVEIQEKRADFYITTIPTLDYYMKQHPALSETMKLHPNCCGGKKPFHLGFSRKSPHFKDEKNPDYDSSQALSPGNFPTRLVKNCLAYKLDKTLKEMAKTGEIELLYNKHFK